MFFDERVILVPEPEYLTTKGWHLKFTILLL